MFKISDGTPLAYSLFCFKIELLILEVMRMLSKHNSIQRDQLEMITLDQLVPANHLVRIIEASIDFTFIYDLVKDMYSEVGRPSIDR
jgi:transposase